MTKQTFIEKAIEGKWLFRGNRKCKRVTFDHPGDSIMVTLENDTFVVMTTIHEIFLDPEAWKAVGKVEGWDKKKVKGIRYCLELKCNQCRMWTTYKHQKEKSTKWNGYEKENDMRHYGCEAFPYGDFSPKYILEMHRMIDALDEKKTIEEYIGTL